MTEKEKFEAWLENEKTVNGLVDIKFSLTPGFKMESSDLSEEEKVELIYKELNQINEAIAEGRTVDITDRDL